MNLGLPKPGPAAPLGGCTDPSAWWKAARRRQDGCADLAAWLKAACKDRSGCSGPTDGPRK